MRRDFPSFAAIGAVIAAFALGACADDASSLTATAPPTLVPLWVADGFDIPEGVGVAPDGSYFISNIAGEDMARDGLGWISKVSKDGAVIAPKFIEGLDAPTGMAVNDGVLYVADIATVRLYDAITGEAKGAAPIDGAIFLNDVTVWQGDVFVSDSGTGRIWRLTGTAAALWREGEELAGVNGLTGVGDKMYICTMGGGDLFEATREGGWRKIATGMKDADGVGVLSQALGGGFLVSSWPGEIFHVDEAGAVTRILDTRDEEIQQNDLTVIGDIVIVPNWTPGTVTAWRIAPAESGAN